MGTKTPASLTVRPRSIEWRIAPKAGKQAGVSEIRSAELDLPEGSKTLIEALRADSEKTVAGLKERIGRVAAPATVGIPASWALLRILDLPAGTSEELRGMVELQIDKFSPFPLESSVVSHEVLTESEGRVRLLAAAAPSDAVELLGSALRSVGITPRRVDVNLLGWWQLLKEAGHVHHVGSQAVLILDGKDCDILVATAGVPVSVRALSGLEDLPEGELAEEIVRETVYTLAALDLDRANEHHVEVSVWHRDAPPEALLKRFAEQGGIEAKAFPLDTLPPVCEGLARRSDVSGTINLAPPSWKQAEAARQTRARVIGASVAVFVAWLLGMAVLFGGLQIEKRRLASLEATRDALSQPADKIRSVRERTMALEQYMDRKRSALECLREISDLLPPGIELKSMSYRKAKNVEISGEAEAVSLIYDFKKEMERSELFAATDLPRIMQMRDGKQAFKLTAIFPGARP